MEKEIEQFGEQNEKLVKKNIVASCAKIVREKEKKVKQCMNTGIRFKYG